MKSIESENPIHHWSMLNVKDRVVLDFGAGRMWEIRPTTPEYFLSQGASKVVGIEMWDNERIWYAENVPDPKLTIITDEINTPEQMADYLMTVQPQAVKCDIEGFESLLNEIPIELFNGIEEMAIEYHDADKLAIIKDNYQRWGFKTIEQYYMSNFNPNEQGVIHLTK